MFFQLAQFGSTITIAVQGMGYSNPSLLHFIGELDDGSKVELIQHVSQLNFLLVAQKKRNPGAPPRRIGFQSPE